MLALLIIAAQVAQGWVVANKVQVAVQDTCDTRTFEKGRDYRVVSRESGSERNDLPIFTNTPGTVKLSATEKPPVSRLDYPNIPGAFLLHNVLTPQECDELLRFSEAMGYTEDAPVSLGRHIRQNENCVWIADPAMNDGIFGRIRAYLPPEVQAALLSDSTGGGVSTSTALMTYSACTQMAAGPVVDLTPTAAWFVTSLVIGCLS